VDIEGGVYEYRAQCLMRGGEDAAVRVRGDSPALGTDRHRSFGARSSGNREKKQERERGAPIAMHSKAEEAAEISRSIE
jgi:hypothetical protein